MAFTCPRCGRTSHNPNDEREGYCGACHGWTGDQQPGTNRQWRTVVKNMTKALAALEQENEGLRAENERLRWALSKGLTESETADFLSCQLTTHVRCRHPQPEDGQR